jgi:fucose 4-O-acetylase-like acetyltransferase
VRERLKEIDIASGITISLVVFGHMLMLKDEGIIWYVFIRDFIYQFHMEVFFFLTGFLFFHTKDIHDKSFSNWKYFTIRVKKFAPPYIFFSLLYYVFELLRAPVKVAFLQGLPMDLYRTFFQPIDSYPTFLWFIYVLLLYYLTVPWLIRLFRGRFIWVLIALSAVLLFIPLPKFLSINLYARYLIYYLLGYLYSVYRTTINGYLKVTGPVLLLCFFGLFGLKFIKIPVNDILVSLTAIPAILYISRLMASGKNIFTGIGQSTYPIYLQNTTIIGTEYHVLKYLVKIEHTTFQYFIPLFFLSAILIPMYLKYIIIKPFRLFKQLLGYV